MKLSSVSLPIDSSYIYISYEQLKRNNPDYDYI